MTAEETVAVAMDEETVAVAMAEETVAVAMADVEAEGGRTAEPETQTAKRKPVPVRAGPTISKLPPRSPKTAEPQIQAAERRRGGGGGAGVSPALVTAVASHSAATLKPLPPENCIRTHAVWLFQHRQVSECPSLAGFGTPAACWCHTDRSHLC